MIHKKTIAIDLDSVLADVMHIWIDEYNLIYNTTIIKQDIVEWDIHKILPLSNKNVNDIFVKVWKQRWKDIPPTSGDISLVIRLLKNAGYRISIITKRERATISYVSFWLDLHNIYFDEIVFIFDNIPKSCHPFFLLIDDSPINAMEISYPKHIVIFDQPWNKTLTNYPRIKKLNELLGLIQVSFNLHYFLFL